jgi:hypothetical protein
MPSFSATSSAPEGTSIRNNDLFVASQRQAESFNGRQGKPKSCDPFLAGYFRPGENSAPAPTFDPGASAGSNPENRTQFMLNERFDLLAIAGEKLTTLNSRHGADAAS